MQTDSRKGRSPAGLWDWTDQQRNIMNKVPKRRSSISSYKPLNSTVDWMARDAIQVPRGNGYTSESRTSQLRRDTTLLKIDAGTDEPSRARIRCELFAESV